MNAPEPSIGTKVWEYARTLIECAINEGDKAIGRFNGCELRANANSTVGSVVEQYVEDRTSKVGLLKPLEALETAVRVGSFRLQILGKREQVVVEVVEGSRPTWKLVERWFGLDIASALSALSQKLAYEHLCIREESIGDVDVAALDEWLRLGNAIIAEPRSEGWLATFLDYSGRVLIHPCSCPESSLLEALCNGVRMITKK